MGAAGMRHAAVFWLQVSAAADAVCALAMAVRVL